MEDRIQKLEKEVLQIKDRNTRVEKEKAWEISKTRAVSILVITYVLVVIVLYFIDVDKPFLNAIIPTLGYFISIQSLPFIKNWWINKTNNF